MRFLPIALVAGLLSAGPDLSTDYGRVRTLRVSAEATLGLATTSFEMTVDGEPIEGRGFSGGMSSKLTRRSVLVDRVLEGAGAEAKKVRRTFETLDESSDATFGEETTNEERSGPLAGLVLELTLDEDGTTTAEIVEGTVPEDETLIEGHALTLALDALLPASAVEEDATWELDDAAVKRGLSLALDPLLFPEPKREEPSGERGQGRRGFGRRGGSAARLLSSVEWTGKATLISAATDHEGESCAQIKLELEAEGEYPEAPARSGGGGGFQPELADLAGSALFEGTIRVTLEGELFVSLARRAPVALELSGQIDTQNHTEREGRDGGIIETDSTQSGEVSLAVVVTEE